MQNRIFLLMRRREMVQRWCRDSYCVFCIEENGYGQEKDAEREIGRKEKGEEGSAEANTAEGGKKERKGIGKN